MKVMRNLIAHVLSLCTISIISTIIGAVPTDYWTLRAQLLNDERYLSLGANLYLRYEEQILDEMLMTAKRKEIDEGFTNPAKFPPARSFLTARDDIEKSEVFKIIREMPKGAVLHSHDVAITSMEYIYSNITFRDGLYLCEVNNTLRLQFMKKDNDGCDWQLLSDLRKNASIAKDLNERIRQRMTMIVDNPDQVYSDVNSAWKKAIDIFDFLRNILAYRPIYEDVFYRGLVELYEDNVMYLELRTTLPELYDLDGTVYGPLDVVQIYKNIADRFTSEHPDFVGVKIIYAPPRKVTLNELREYLDIVNRLKKEFPTFIAGFDLVGQEDKGQPLSCFADQLKNVDPEINFFFHAGETNWNGLSTDENLIDAVLLNTKRIGHGYALVKHPLVTEMVKQKNIAVEINPISNQVLGLVKDLRNHPANSLFAIGFPTVVSNDDPCLWGSKGLSYDFYEAFMGLMSKESGLRSLKKLAKNSLEFSSMDAQEKSSALQKWENKWFLFVKKLLYHDEITAIRN